VLLNFIDHQLDGAMLLAKLQMLLAKRQMPDDPQRFNSSLDTRHAFAATTTEHATKHFRSDSSFSSCTDILVDNVWTELLQQYHQRAGCNDCLKILYMHCNNSGFVDIWCDVNAVPCDRAVPCRRHCFAVPWLIACIFL
jgi:hypothetical protein